MCSSSKVQVAGATAVSHLQLAETIAASQTQQDVDMRMRSQALPVQVPDHHCWQLNAALQTSVVAHWDTFHSCTLGVSTSDSQRPFQS